MGCGASAKKGDAKTEDKDKKGEKGEKKDEKGGEAKKDVDINEKLEKIEFQNMDIEPVDSTFSKAGAIFDEIMSTNTRLVDGVQAVIRSETVKGAPGASDDDADLSKTSSKVLAQRITDALVGARDAMEDAMPDNVAEIRQKVMSIKENSEKAATKTKDRKKEEQQALEDSVKKDTQDVAKMVTAALPKMKTLLPKVEGSSISFPEGIKLDKLQPGARAAMDMVIQFFELLKQIGTEAVASLKQKCEDILAEIKALPPKLKDLAKEKLEPLGLADKAKFLKEKTNLLTANSKLAAKLKEYIEKLVKKIAAVGQILSGAFSQALEVALKYAPGVMEQVKGAVASAKASATKIADSHKEDIDAAKAKAGEMVEKGKEAAGPKGAPSEDKPKEEAAPAQPEAAKSVPPAAEPEKKAEAPAAAAPSAEAAAPAAEPAAPSVAAAAESEKKAEEPAAPAAEPAAPAAAAEAALVAEPALAAVEPAAAPAAEPEKKAEDPAVAIIETSAGIGADASAVVAEAALEPAA